MGNFLHATISIVGTRLFLWHHFTADVLSLEKKEKTGVAGNDPHEWNNTVLVTKERQLYIPPSYIFSMLVSAAKYTKKGRGNLVNSVAATLQCTNKKILMNRFLPDNIEKLYNAEDEDVFIHTCSVVNPATKGRNMRYRVAANAGWELDFDIMWDKTIVSTNEMMSVIIDGGKLVGLGDGRKIGYGRFDVKDKFIRDADDDA